MKNIAAIVAKELTTYFVSPIAYFVLFIFTAVSGFLFSMILLNFSAYQESSTLVMQILFANISVTLLFFTPALTMKLFTIPASKPKKIEKETTHDIDITIKAKPKPKFNFDISSMLKDLRNDQTLMNTEQAEKVLTKDKPIKQSKNKESKAQLSISEIDLLIQQLSSCWSAPAGAVIKKGMVVKISAK